MKIGFIGFGNIAKGITAGLITKKKDVRIYYYDIQEEVVKNFSFADQIQKTKTIEELESSAEVVIFSVKPKDMKNVVMECKNPQNQKHYISVAAGISLSTILSWNPKLTQIARVMPNIATIVQHSVSAIYSQNPETVEIAKTIFDQVGITLILNNEEMMHAFTALGGSGPAFVLSFLDGMIEAGIREGFSYETAYWISLHILMGTAKLLLEEYQQNQQFLHPADLKRKITSPAGTTIEGLVSLEKYAIKYALIEAVHQATLRSKELGK
ncbi:MAG: pyrroline-5-carboxylate reductase [Leptospiraceae bacterium]|nr:pyrroline-5-carboxylate reductase [Leptospiraceae bacterium]MDW7975563.1 pyrroline-5-carboxylate reductase [Leptospiraceae bacterium]